MLANKVCGDEAADTLYKVFLVGTGRYKCGWTTVPWSIYPPIGCIGSTHTLKKLFIFK